MCDKSLGGLDYEKVAVLRITTYMNCSKSKMFMLALASFLSLAAPRPEMPVDIRVCLMTVACSTSHILLNSCLVMINGMIP